MNTRVSVSIALLLACGPFSGTVIKCHAEEIVVKPVSSNLTFNNPLKGWCPYPDQIHQNSSMVFLYVPWKSLEPTKGNYKFAEWEADKKFGWAHPGACGKRIIFRVVVDYPEEESGRFGLPDWLRAEGVKEFPYSEHGGGKSPDYGNTKFIEAAERLIRELGRRYNPNHRVAFVQLGILGHWGEWHVVPTLVNAGHSIAERARIKVIDAYRHSFPDKILMCRNADKYAGKHDWLGYHDDFFPDDTLCEDGNWCFLKNLRDNGRQDNWMAAPFGGEMEPDQAHRLLGGKEFNNTMAAAEKAHFSWIGPYSPASEYATSEVFQDRCDSLTRAMGYRFQLNEIGHDGNVEVGKPLKVSVKGKNSGVAPFYYQWPVVITLIDSEGHQAFTEELSIDIRKWSAQSDFSFSVMPLIDKLTPSDPTKPYLNGAEFRLSLGIIDPWKGMPGIRFANELPVFFGWTELSNVKLVK